MTPGTAILVRDGHRLRQAVVWRFATYHVASPGHAQHMPSIVLHADDRGVVWVPDVPGEERDAFIVANALR